MRKLLVALLFLPLIAFSDDKSAPSAASAVQSQAVNNELQTNKHYTNSDGQVVRSPSKTESGKAPVGATAKCRDGSYSFSQHRTGTCSHHGGVESWL